jgi:hypothetical protein
MPSSFRDAALPAVWGPATLTIMYDACLLHWVLMFPRNAGTPGEGTSHVCQRAPLQADAAKHPALPRRRRAARWSPSCA